MKKGQVSLFIILGLVILLLIALALYLQELQWDLDPEIDKQYIVSSSVEPVRLYVEECLKQVSRDPVIEIGMNGGTLEQSASRWYYGQRYNYLAYNEPGFSHVQTLLLRQDMEKELEAVIRERLPLCIDLSVFERQAFIVETGEMEVNVTIGKHDVRIELHYPIQLEKEREEMELTISIFNVRLTMPLGLLYDKAIEIINSENTYGYFDQVHYIVNNDNLLEIEKHRPYPDIIYNLTKEGYSFRFAVQGESSVSQAGYSQFLDSYGCCYNTYDKNCYKNVPMDVCELKNGIYDLNPNCVCPETDDLNTVTCEGGKCKDCKRTYDYVTGRYTKGKRQHGESWCVYDSIAGKGYDYVGSRHYLHYCIDGIEYVEECRDYREELCTEETGLKEGQPYSRAICRLNRWQDCHTCKSRQCCENLEFRDCHWKDWLNTEGKCVPYVPPGFRFWEAGTEICSLATETKECEGFSCPNIWVDDTAIYCYMHGDCGNYRNIQDRISYGGFFNSDFQDQVRDYVYLEDGETKKGNDYEIDLGIENRKTVRMLSTPLEEAQDNFMRLWSIAMNYIDSITSFSISEFLNPFEWKEKVRIMDIALCDVWQPPWGGADCSLCEAGSMRPCTEYRCRSLGKQCEYEEVSGFPRCYAIDTDDMKGPEIVFDSNYLKEGHTMDESTLKIRDTVYEGREITPDVKPYEMLALRINTSEESICRIEYLPRLKYISLPSYYMGDSRFSYSHNITMRVPGRIEVPQKALDIFNLTSLTDLVEMLEEPKRFLETYKTRYGTQLGIIKTVTGEDLVELIEPYADEILAVIEEISDTVPFYRELLQTLLASFEEGHYYLFIECRDRAGNVNPKEVFIKLGIDSLENDTQPPVILGFSPENDSMIESSVDRVQAYMYISEPALCRYDDIDKDFSEMYGQFTCPGSRYNIHPRFGGSYECKGTINTTYADTEIFIRCLDNPKRIVSYPLRVALSSESGIDGAEPSKYHYVVSPGSIFASATALREEITFLVEEPALQLHLYLDDLMNCTYTYDLIRKPLKNCIKTRELELGLYMCEADIELTSGEGTQNETILLRIHPVDSANGAGIEVSGRNLKINYSELGADSADVYLNRTEINFALYMEEYYACSYKKEGIVELMSCVNVRNQTKCYTELHTDNTYEIVCMKKPDGIGGTVSPITITCEMPGDYPQNVNTKGTHYVLHKSAKLEITDSGPSGEVETMRPLLYVDTNFNPGLRCGIYQDLELGTLLMKNITQTHHEIQVDASSGENVYYIHCRDGYGNTVDERIDFFVIV